MKEERVAQDVVARWNCQQGEERGVIFLQVPQETAPDVYVFLIDNIVDIAKIDTASATGAKVVLFFSMYHYTQNTMSSKIKSIEERRDRIQANCFRVDYKNCAGFE